MKTIYSKLGSTYYTINQDTSEPSTLTVYDKPIASNSNYIYREKTNEVEVNILLNTIDDTTAKTNKELYAQMITDLTGTTVTKITQLQNIYKTYIDYSIICDGKEEHYVAINKIDAPDFADLAYILGIMSDNSCEYRRVKIFRPEMTLKSNLSLTYGISKPVSKTRYVKINDIVIFEQVNETADEHESTYQQAFQYGSATVQSTLENMVPIYSTKTEGITFDAINPVFTPLTIKIKPVIYLSSYITAYTDEGVNTVLTTNASSIS